MTLPHFCVAFSSPPDDSNLHYVFHMVHSETAFMGKDVGLGFNFIMIAYTI